MRLWSLSFLDRRSVPTKFAFGRYRNYPRDLAEDERVEFSDNLSPHLAWDDAPDGTKSFAIVCRDHDAPASRDGVNTKGSTVSREAERATFVHLVLADLPAECRELAEGALSEGVVPGGKSAVEGPHGSRQGINDYTSWFADDPEMKGTYRGYDGPCPPWNDELIHWYEFTLYALGVEKLELSDDFTDGDLVKAIDGHVVGTATLEGFYYIHDDAKFGPRGQMTEREQPRSVRSEAGAASPG